MPRLSQYVASERSIQSRTSESRVAQTEAGAAIRPLTQSSGLENELQALHNRFTKRWVMLIERVAKHRACLLAQGMRHGRIML